MLEKLSGSQSGRTVAKKKKKKENLFTYSIRRAGAISKFPDAAVQWRLRNVQKSVMHVQSCCFANLNLLLFSFSLPSPSSFLMLPSVVIQKFCFHGNVTSHFSSLFSNHRWSKRTVQSGSLRVLKILNNGDSFVLNIPKQKFAIILAILNDLSLE